MKIIFITTGDIVVPSSRTRVFQYIPYLRARGFRCRVLVGNKKEYYGEKYFPNIPKTLYHTIVIVKFLFYCLIYKIIYVHRVILPKNLLKPFKLLNKRIVFDFDDAIYSIQKTLAGPVDCEKTEKKEDRFKDIIAISDLVILENDYNREYISGFNKKILMITGPIDTETYYPLPKKENRDKVVIGWIGSSTNTVYLKFILPVLERLCKRYPEVCLKFIGAAPVSMSCDCLQQLEWRLETEVRELQEFDIGIMPLIDEEWSRGKGGYKILQYMAVGIPTIASPVGINNQLIQEKVNGFLCNNEQEWYDKLSYLVENLQIRKNMGLKAREMVEEKYSLRKASKKIILALLELNN